MPELPKSLKVLVNGETGTGKTYFGLTFPKVYYLGTEPNGLDTARANPQLLKNVVVGKEFIPGPNLDLKQLFLDLDKAILEAHTLAKEKKVETLVLDNLTYLAQNRWLYLNEFEKQVSPRTGNLDTQSMYGALGTWLYKFTLMSLLSFNGNVVVSCHEQKEDTETLQERVDPTVPIVPNVLGSFRTKVGGMFSASIYLQVKQVAPDKYKYVALCQKGQQRGAKNRYNLPPIVEDVSYQKIMQVLNSHV